MHAQYSYIQINYCLFLINLSFIRLLTRLLLKVNQVVLDLDRFAVASLIYLRIKSLQSVRLYIVYIFSIFYLKVIKHNPKNSPFRLHSQLHIQSLL